MSILGWIALGTCFIIAVYLWYMCLCFFLMLRASSVNTRRVLAAIAALPVNRYAKPSSSSNEQDDDEPATCSICLSEFEEGELIRTLPCGHEFRKPCIDLWIRRQGTSASCPLCKRSLVPRDREPDAAAEDLGTAPLQAVVERSDASGAEAAAEMRAPPAQSAQPEGYRPPEVPAAAGAAEERAAPDVEEARASPPAAVDSPATQ